VAMAIEQLPYLIMDADEHSNPSTPDMYERYIDPKHRDKAIRTVKLPDGTEETLYAGRPARLKARPRRQITFSTDQLEEMGIDRVAPGEAEMERNAIPGSLLNRFNPLKGLDEQGRKDFAERYRNLSTNYATPDLRMSIMDMQGVECTVNYLTFGGRECNLEHDIEALYANQHAANRCYAEEWGFSYQNRLFTPPYISTVDAALAEEELDYVMGEGTRIIQISTGPSVHRSPFRPELDRFWSKVNDASVNVCTHLGNTFYAQQGVEWDEVEVDVGDMDAFQWAMYYGDRPAMETVAAAILQGWLARFPNIKLLISEQGTMWVPYLVRKMDHAFLMGRKATWGTLEMRPSDYFRQRVFVAPFPEENVERVVDAVGIDPIVFGSDFPHGEGLPEPLLYLKRLEGFDAAEVKAIMRDNMARYLGIPA
jgi:predicted TIM-barrel fold metal-dependent hydrolase